MWRLIKVRLCFLFFLLHFIWIFLCMLVWVCNFNLKYVIAGVPVTFFFISLHMRGYTDAPNAQKLNRRRRSRRNHVAREFGSASLLGLIISDQIRDSEGLLFSSLFFFFWFCLPFFATHHCSSDVFCLSPLRAPRVLFLKGVRRAGRHDQLRGIHPQNGAHDVKKKSRPRPSAMSRALYCSKFILLYY